MIDLNPTTSRIIRNITGLHTPVKRQRLSYWTKSETQLLSVYKKLTLNLRAEIVQK